MSYVFIYCRGRKTRAVQVTAWRWECAMCGQKVKVVW